MGDEIRYKEWRIDVMQTESGWEALIYRPNSLLHEVSVPHRQNRRAVIEEAQVLIDELLACEVRTVKK
jgi:hypothetical protein